MKISAKTDIGVMRHSNQDAYVCGKFPEGDVWAVVCDGMGGASGGDVASTMATEIVSDKLLSSYNPNMPINSLKNLFESAITTANVLVHNKAQINEELRGMGTTVVSAIVRNNGVLIAHVGDSRAYIYNKESGLQQITKDHSVVQEMVDRGEITEEEARIHPRKNIITRALGVSNEIEIDFYECDTSEESVVLLCSDGLSNFVDDKTIEEYIKTEPIETLGEKLVDKANSNGGGDNITVVAVSY